MSSPELDRLVEALYQKRTCPYQEKRHRNATFERLLKDALARVPGTSRDELLVALEDRYQQYRLQHRKRSTLPPKA